MVGTLLVTGGAGFIGAGFVRCALSAEPEVNVVTLDALTYAGNRRNLSSLPPDMARRHTLVVGDIRDADLLARLFDEHGFAGVVHLAAESHVDRSIRAPEIFVETNVLGTFRLLEASRVHWEGLGRPAHFRFLHVSTDEVYGSLGPEGVFTEDAPYDPSSPYSASKASADHFCRAYHRTYGFPAIVTNCANNYGPRQFAEKLIPLTIERLRESREIPVYGDGANVREWLYVEDHCAALSLVLEKGRVGATYHVGSGDERRNIDVVHKLCDLVDAKLGRRKGTGRKLVRFVGDRPGHDRRYALDSSRIRAELGWAPRVPFDEGLERTVDWYLGRTQVRAAGG